MSDIVDLYLFAKFQRYLILSSMYIKQQIIMENPIKYFFYYFISQFNAYKQISVTAASQNYIVRYNIFTYNIGGMSYTNVVFKQNICRNVNKDQIQKQRLDDRVGYQSRFQTAGNLIFKPQQKSTLHVSQQERFNKNHDVNDRLKRNNDREKAEHFYDARLNKRMEREQNRWDHQIKKQQHEESKRLHHQKILLQNKRNTNGLGYNPITQAYEQSDRGNKLRQVDEGKQVNRYVRSRNIVQKNNGNFNIITGEAKVPYNQLVPQKLQQRVQAKYENKKQREAVKYEPIRDKYDYLDD